MRRGIELIAPHRSNRKKPATQDGRALRRYKRRWIIERTNAWLGNFRRFGLATTSESGREAGIESAPTLGVAPLRCGSRRSPSLRSATAKPPEERTPREFPLISPFFFLALLIN